MTLTTIISAFFVIMAIEQLGAAALLALHGNYPLAGIYLFYGLSSLLYIYLI